MEFQIRELSEIKYKNRNKYAIDTHTHERTHARTHTHTHTHTHARADNKEDSQLQKVLKSAYVT